LSLYDIIRFAVASGMSPLSAARGVVQRFAFPRHLF
jgi:hypothetical protein